ncbi:unnamed protein product [Musa textilis]
MAYLIKSCFFWGVRVGFFDWISGIGGEGSPSGMAPKPLDYESLNENVKKVAYAVRGELYLRASELQKEGKKVIALCQAPFLLDDPNVGLLFPADAIERAKHYLSLTSGGLGAYSDSRGLPGIRKEIAEFIGRRDGYPSDPELIYLTDGASKGVMQILNTIIRNENDGILVPVPQYPLYSATISLYGGSLVPYYLEEEANWGLDINHIRQSVAAARMKGICVRALVIINPGNPTGQCLSEANLRELLKFCFQENIVLLADEVYQQNIYQDERPFISARKILLDMGPPISTEVQLVSFHTVSKGYWGECGQRGGYFEMTNLPAKTVDEIYKVASVSLSPNVPGQIFLGLMVNPPKPGDISYLRFAAESNAILESLKRRAHIMTDGFNSCRNVVCNFTEGAMYSFPQIRLPPKAIEAAKRAGKAPDVFYCLKLVEATGISTVPGSGFGQKEGVFHLRTTILPAEEEMPAIMDSFKKFNDEFMEQYEDYKDLASRRSRVMDSMALVLHAGNANKNAFKRLIAADYSGFQVELTENFEMGVSNKTSEFPKTNPIGKVVTCLKADNPLYGSSRMDYAHIEQLIDFASMEVDATISRWLYPRLGYMPYLAVAEESAISCLKRTLRVLNPHLAVNMFLVGHSVTLADIIMTCNLYLGFSLIMLKSFTSEFSHVERYFWTMVNQPNFRKVLGVVKQADSVPFVPSQKKSQTKEVVKPKKVKKERNQEAVEPKVQEVVEEEEEEEAPKPNPKNPLDLLLPSKMILNEWKRLYSNTKANFRELAIKGFWDMYDPVGYSFWFRDYKYNDENTVSFVTLNKVSGFLQRMDLARKYAFGKMLVTGSDPPFKVKGLWLFHGLEIPKFVLDEVYDMELYDWTKVDISDEAQKE